MYVRTYYVCESVLDVLVDATQLLIILKEQHTSMLRGSCMN